MVNLTAWGDQYLYGASFGRLLKLKEGNEEQGEDWKHHQKIVQQIRGIKIEEEVGRNKWKRKKGKDEREART